MHRIIIADMNSADGFHPMETLLEGLQTNNTGYILLDMDSKEMKFSQRALYFFLPYKNAKRDVGRDELMSLIAPEDAAAVAKFVEDCKNGKIKAGEINFRLHNWATMPMWLRCTVKKLSQFPDVLLGIIENRTEETYNQMIVESCLDGTYIADIRYDKGMFTGEVYSKMQKKNGVYRNVVQEFFNSIAEEDLPRQIESHQKISTNKIEYSKTEYRIYNQNNEPTWIANRNKIIYGNDGEAALIVGGYFDISAMRSYNEYLENSIETCELTGLFNRHRLNKDFSARLQQGNKRGYALYCRVDDFANINSGFKVDVTREFLKQVGAVLLDNSPQPSVVYHIEPGVFVVMMPCASKEQAEKTMKRLSWMTGMPLVIQGENFFYSTSVVAVPYLQKDVVLDEFLKKCALAMREIQQGEKNRYLMLTPKLHQQQLARLELENRLRESVAKGMEGFFVLYQPFIDAGSGCCVGAEALLRWRDAKEGGVVSPVVFIPLLEELGVMDVVGEWVLNNAARQCKKWISNGFDKNFYISVNVSAPQLSDPCFAPMVLKYLKEIGLPARNIVIEITESVLLLDVQRGTKQLNILKENGIKIALDDFGTGYSSLSYLKNLPVDEIKIDRSFIQDIESDDFSREFVASIIKIAKTLQRDICLEGVETSFQVDILKQMNADIFQGFLFAAPQEVGQLEAFYALPCKHA